jgi:hypothetical protein
MLRLKLECQYTAEAMAWAGSHYGETERMVAMETEPMQKELPGLDGAKVESGKKAK